MTLSPTQRAELSQKMTEALSMAEIDGICFELAVDSDDIPGSTRAAKIRELIQHFERRGLLNVLVARVRAARPHLPWPKIPSLDGGNSYNNSAHADVGGNATVTNNFGSPASQPLLPPTSAKKITVLFLAANPKSTDRLRLDEEVRTIDERLRLSQFRDRFDLQQQWAVRTSDILDAVLRHKPDVVHFSGHGSITGDLVFEDSAGNAKAVSADALGALFAARKGVRCVVLNACWSDTHANAIAKAVDCVVGMTRSVGDDAAIGFASGFYRSLGERLSVQEAFDLGKVQIMLDGGDEEKTPRLHTRKGVDAGAVVLA